MLSALSRQGDVRFMLYEDSMNQQRLIIYGPAGSNLQPKSFPDFGQLKGAPWEEGRSLAGQASG